MDLVTGALGRVVEKLGELLKEEYNLQTGVREKITTLSRDLVSMHAALRKLDEVPLDELDEEAKLWAEDIREMSYDAEDILEQELYKTAANRIHELLNLSKYKARHEIADMVKNINEKANEVAIRRARYTTGDIVAKPAPYNTVDPRLELSNKEVKLVGIEEPSSELISMLRDDVSTKKLKIISIVGFGGLGKTTLAKVVYDKIKPEYDCGAFVSVGRKPDTKKLLRDILIDLDKISFRDPNILLPLDEWQLIQKLQDALRGKRYLIVIDDIWERQTWRRIQNAFAEDNNGSGIITTTRKEDTITLGMHCHKLKPLPDGIAKRLFYTRLFGGEGECPANHPVEASEKILRKCGGVPLAILTMASLLEGKSTEYWSHVSNSTRIFGGKDNDQVDVTARILSLSYYDLPSELKTCLLYLSVYPEDYEIEKDSLIWKWIGEGFIKKKTGTSLFEQGEEYFNQLINRSMIQAVESERMGIVDSCHVHDMVLDLIRDLSHELNFVTVSNDDEGTPLLGKKVRRLAYQNRMMKQTTGKATERSLVSCRCDIESWILDPSFKLLRVLALEECRVPQTGWQGLEHLGNLLHLRYLGLRGTFGDYELPEEIGNLKFLQTLELDDLFLGVLPSGVCHLTQLLCLRGGLYTKAPDGLLTKLTSLEVLEINIDDLSDESKRQFMKDLGNLSEARVLRISGTLNNWMVQSEQVQSLGKLHKLQHLQLQHLQAPASTLVLSRHLQSLILGRICCFHRLPLWISPAHLPSLHILHLRVDELDEAGLRALGGLPELHELDLSSTRRQPREQVIANITAGEGLFNKLRCCYLDGWMVQLDGVSFSMWNGEGAMPFGRYTTDADDEHSSRWSAALPPVMPNLQEFLFEVTVRALYKDGNGGCDNLGLEFLPSLRKVIVYVDCEGATADDVERVKAELTHALKLHPNKPIFEIDLRNENKMMAQSTDDQDAWRRVRRRTGIEGEISSAGDEVAHTPSC